MRFKNTLIMITILLIIAPFILVSFIISDPMMSHSGFNEIEEYCSAKSRPHRYVLCAEKDLAEKKHGKLVFMESNLSLDDGSGCFKYIYEDENSKTIVVKYVKRKEIPFIYRFYSNLSACSI